VGGLHSRGIAEGEQQNQDQDNNTYDEDSQKDDEQLPDEVLARGLSWRGNMWMRWVNPMGRDGKRGVRSESPGVAAHCFPLSMGVRGSRGHDRRNTPKSGRGVDSVFELNPFAFWGQVGG
jgi:hypothetical protein